MQKERFQNPDWDDNCEKHFWKARLGRYWGAKLLKAGIPAPKALWYRFLTGEDFVD